MHFYCYTTSIQLAITKVYCMDYSSTARSNGEKKHEFSSATWKSFNIDLKKYDKSYKMKAKEFVKKKKKTKERKKR